jgi:hypothetical protein
MSTQYCWFDKDSGVLRIDELVCGMPSWEKIMADGVVTEEEVAEHGQRVVALLRKMDEMLTGEAHETATQVLCEIAVLYGIKRQRELQSAR